MNIIILKIENTMLYFLSLMVITHAQINYILDGDFENFVDDANPTSGTWYNGISETSSFFIRTVDGSKALEIKANPKEVCQNVTLPSSATYTLAYYYKGTSTITLSLMIDDLVILTKDTPGSYVREEIYLNLAIGSHKVCFERPVSPQKAYIDNITLTLYGNIVGGNSTNTTNENLTNHTTNGSAENNGTDTTNETTSENITSN